MSNYTRKPQDRTAYVQLTYIGVSNRSSVNKRFKYGIYFHFKYKRHDNRNMYMALSRDITCLVYQLN